jgi:hypothetical protein
MADNVDPNQKQPGEKQEGKFHYNPGNQSGKTIDVVKPEDEQVNNKDRIENRERPKSG